MQLPSLEWGENGRCTNPVSRAILLAAIDSEASAVAVKP